MTLSVKKFIESGRLGRIDKNSTKIEVLKELGEPSDFSERKKIYILKYNNLEITFHKGNLYMTVIYNKNPKAPFLIEDELLDLSFNSFISQLEREEISWSVEERYTTPQEASVIKIDSSGVLVNFDPLKHQVDSIMCIYQ